MNELRVPLQPAVICIDRDQGVREQISTWPILSVPVGTCGSDRRKYGPVFRVYSHRRPHINAGAILPGVPGPALEAILTGQGHRVKGPDKPACSRIPGADVTARSRRWRFAWSRAGDHEIAIDGYRVWNLSLI